MTTTSEYCSLFKLRVLGLGLLSSLECGWSIMDNVIDIISPHIEQEYLVEAIDELGLELYPSTVKTFSSLIGPCAVIQLILNLLGIGFNICFFIGAYRIQRNLVLSTIIWIPINFILNMIVTMAYALFLNFYDIFFLNIFFAIAGLHLVIKVLCDLPFWIAMYTYWQQLKLDELRTDSTEGLFETTFEIRMKRESVLQNDYKLLTFLSFGFVVLFVTTVIIGILFF